MKKAILLILAITVSIYSLDAQWQQINCPIKGRVTCITVKGPIIFAGSGFNGIFMSENEGESWSEVNTGLTNNSVNAISFAGLSVLAGTDDGIFKSTDNGKTWVETPVDLPAPSYISSFSISDKKVFAGSFEYGLVESDIDLAGWSAVYDIMDEKILSMAAAKTKVFAGTNGNGMFSLSNNSSEWKADNGSQLELDYTTIVSLAVSGNNIYSGAAGGVFLSSDEGMTWTGITNDLPDYSSVSVLAVSGNILFAATKYNGLYYTTDNGITWNTMDLVLPENDVVSALAISDNYIFAGTDNGAIWKFPLNVL